jgi:5-methylcytosine-specific restriction endonuclease McrA
MFQSYAELQLQLSDLPQEKVYEKLLLTIEWRDFREQHLKRDGYSCLHCKKKDGEYFSERILLNAFEVSSRNKAIERWVTMFLKITKSNILNRGGTYNENVERDILMKKAQHSHAEYKFERVVLQLHHTYYIFNSLPWQYPSASLKTLCIKCHTEVHNSIKIPVYQDKDLTRIHGYRGNCSRCAGTGHLSEYNHIQGGICFECGGSGGHIERV